MCPYLAVRLEWAVTIALVISNVAFAELVVGEGVLPLMQVLAF